MSKKGTVSQVSFYTQQLRTIAMLQQRPFEGYTEERPPRFKNQHELRDYQLQGVNWLIKQWYQGKPPPPPPR